MAVGDKYVLTLVSHEGGEPENVFNNVFAYEAGDAACTAEDLADAFSVDVLGFLKAAISSGTTFTDVNVINLDNPADFALFPVTGAGLLGGDYLPRFNAIEFEYVRAVRGVHSGRKSFSLVPRDQQVDGEPISGYVPVLNTLAANLADNVVGSASQIYIPRIWRRAGSYGTPPTAFPDTFYPISTVRFGAISTQNTRKR